MPTQARLAVIFGDQLDLDAALIRTLGPDDTVLMMEVADESRHVPSHAQRTGLFLSAMRHFAGELVRRKRRVRYVALDDPDNTGSFETEIARAVAALNPAEIVCTHPGEWRVLAMLQRVRDSTGLPLTILPDEHFLTTPDQFAAWASGRTSLTMEFFYREQRRKTGYLMEGVGRNAQPAGGAWNFDKENRLIGVQGGTRAKIIQREGDLWEVRILEGPWLARSGWLTSEPFRWPQGSSGEAPGAP